MIRELLIKNFALIGEARLEFGPGLNVLSGETGAGKSILLAALGLILGERADPNLLRQGQENCSVSGYFQLPETAPARRFLGDNNLSDSADPTLILHRELNLTGKNRCFINGRPVPLAMLSDLGQMLVDIHGQHEHQALLKTTCQQETLDTYGQLSELYRTLKKLYQDYRGIIAERQSLEELKKERSQKLDLLNFQEQEISQARLSAEEEKNLAEEYSRLYHSEKLRALFGEAGEQFFGGEESVRPKFQKVIKIITAAHQFDPALQELLGQLEEINLVLEDGVAKIRSYLDKIESDPQRLEEIIARQQLYRRLKNKYGGTVEEVITWGEKVKKELAQFSGIGEEGLQLEKRQKDLADRFSEKKKFLIAQRKKTAERLIQAVEKQFSDLGLNAAKLKIIIKQEDNPAEPFWEEKDAVEFLFAPNPGEGFRTLAKIISGGELSRIMLALKTIFAQADNIPVLVFDEIDNGVSGTMGAVVGKKLLELARHHQLICVTHLPQIAACAEEHFYVNKEVKNGRTLTSVVKLNKAERTEEIARMLSGEKLTTTARRHAEELLKQSA